MTLLFQDFFTGAALDAAWTRRNIVSGDETWLGPGLTVANLGAGDFYLMTAPAGDFTVELEFTGKSTGSDMIGVAILDSGGSGVMASAYSGPAAVLNLAVSGYSYGGIFASAGGANYAAARVRLTKVGLAFTTAYSTNGGSSWSSESSSLSPIASVSKIGIGSILSSGSHITLVELRVDGTLPAVTGTLATTLDSSTLAASGTVLNPVTGTLATTLDGATLAASGTVLNPVTGTLATTLADATLAASGTVLQVYYPDTSNAALGLDLVMVGTTTQTVPVVAPPASLVLAQKVDKAVAYPTPDMVDGRPT